MRLPPLILALFLAQSGTPVATLHVGDSVDGLLPVLLQDHRNAEKRVYVLELDAAGPCTVRLESADFDPRLTATAPGDAASTRVGARLAHWDAWLSIDGPSGTRRELTVESEDDHGGAYRLSVVAGVQEPPADPLQRGPAVVASCALIAERAETREEWERAARIRDTASRAAFAIRDVEAARTHAEFEIRDAARAGAGEWDLKGRINLGPALRELGELALAESTLASALAPAREWLAKTEGAPAHANWVTLVCFLYSNLAELRSKVRGPGEAKPLYEAYAELSAKCSRRDIEVDAWCKLGFVLDETGEALRAKEAIEKGVEVAEGIPDRPEALVSARLSLARYLAKHGRFPESRALCDLVLGQEIDPFLRIEFLGVLANACIELSRYEQARVAMDELQSACDAQGVHDYGVPIRLNRSTIAYRLGDYARARSLLEEALAMADAAGSSRDRIEVLTSLGRVLDAQGEKDHARQRFDEALEACERTHDGDRAARILVGLGVLFESEGEISPALSALDRAELLASREKDTRVAAASLVGRAFLLYRKGELSAALAAATTASAVLEDMGQRQDVLHAQNTIARVGLATGDLARVEDALCYAETYFDEQNEERFDSFAAAGWRSPYADWSGIGQDLFARRVASAKTPAEACTAMEDGLQLASRWKARVLLERMRSKVPARSSELDWIGPAPTPGSVLVEYVEGLDRLYAYVLAGGAVKLLDLGDRASLELEGRSLVEGVALRRLTPSAFAGGSARLAARLLLPVEAAVPPGTSRWTFVPTAALATLPMEILIDPKSVAEAGSRGYDGLRYVLDSAESVSYAPSSAVLARLKQGRAPRRAERFLIAGDPIYRRELEGTKSDDPVVASRPGSALLDYNRLKGTRIEASEVANLLMVEDPAATPEQRSQLLELIRQRSATIHTSRFDLYVGQPVTTDLFRGDLSAYTHVHVAAHGHVDPTDPRRSGLVLGYEPATGGLLSLEDLLQVRLDADLVVLSACDTANGPVVRGEGIQSLANAVLEAGSRAVVASLWKVDDGDAAELMREFYGRTLDEKVPADRALRLAKLAFRQSKDVRGNSPGGFEGYDVFSPANPYYWCSFVYVGPCSD